MKPILITAFKRPDYFPENSSEIVASRLQGLVVNDDVLVNTLNWWPILPARGMAGFLMEITEECEASAIISLNMDPEKQGLSIESYASNRVKYHGRRCSVAIDNNWPFGARLKADLEPWRVHAFRKYALQEGLAIERVSTDAGNSYSNHFMWDMLSLMNRFPGIRVPFIFIHLPCSPESVLHPKKFKDEGKVTMEISDMVRGIKILLQLADLKLVH